MGQHATALAQQPLKGRHAAPAGSNSKLKTGLTHYRGLYSPPPHPRGGLHGGCRAIKKSCQKNHESGSQPKKSARKKSEFFFLVSHTSSTPHMGVFQKNIFFYRKNFFFEKKKIRPTGGECSPPGGDCRGGGVVPQGGTAGGSVVPQGGGTAGGGVGPGKKKFPKKSQIFLALIDL